MQPPFHRFEEFISLPPADINLVRGWAANPRRIARHQPIRREGDPVNGVFFLLAGWAASSVILRDGQRQVIKVHVPGDMLGFPSLVLSSAGETLEAITDASVCPISNAAIGRVIEQHPQHGRHEHQRGRPPAFDRRDITARLEPRQHHRCPAAQPIGQ